MIYVVVTFLLVAPLRLEHPVHGPHAGGRPDPADHLLGGAPGRGAGAGRAPRAGGLTRDHRVRARRRRGAGRGRGGHAAGPVRARHHPDLVLGTSVGALNGAMVARDPSPAVIDRLTDLWQTVATSREVFGDRPLRTVRRAVSTGTHVYSSSPMRKRLVEEFGDMTLRGPAGHLPGVCRQHRTGRRALVRRRPDRGRDRGQRGRARAAAAGQGRRRALPRRRHRQLDPARPRGRARRRRGLRPPGRPHRPPARRCPGGRGRSPASRSRSPAGTGSPASWPRCPRAWSPTCCPARGTSSRDDSLLGHRDFAGVSSRIEETYHASLAYLDEHVPR